MKEAEKLLILKRDLQLRTSSNDEYLSFLLSGAKKLMQREGITLIEGDTNCDMVQIQYAAYLFRRRGGEETSMPRFLRYELNNLLFSQKGRIDT